MIIIPAIDVIDGKCVRLTQGDYGQMKVYREDPVEVALEFQQADLEYLHLVDLEGAKKGKVINWKVIQEIQEKTALLIDFGGGVQTTEDVEELINLGVNQINVGSTAIKQPELFIEWMKGYGAENFILSADVKNEYVMINGWLESTNFRLYDLVEKYMKEGLEYITATDISSDGMLQGPNISLYKNLRKLFPTIKIFASGGITTLDDLTALKDAGINGAIIGKALYEGKLKLEELKLL